MSVAVLILAAILPYLISIRGQFILDDNAIAHMSWIQQGRWREWHTFTYWRPLTYMSYALNCAWFGGYVKNQSEVDHKRALVGYHAGNILCHVVAVLAFAWAMGFYTSHAWMAAMVLALHPLASQSVAYVSGRFSTLAGLFCFLGLGLMGAGWPILACVAVVIGAAAKEDAVAFLPVLSVAGWYAVVPGWWIPLAVAVLGAAYMAPKIRELIGQNCDAEMQACGMPAALKTPRYQITAIVEHLARLSSWIVGWGNCVDPEIPRLSVGRGVAAAVGLVVLGSVLLSAPLGLLAAAMIVCSVLPYILVPMPDPVMEQRCYVMTAGIAVALASYMPWWGLAWLGCRTAARCWYWRTSIETWTQCVRDGGREDRAYTCLAAEYFGKNDLVTAKSMARLAIQARPSAAIPRTSLAIALWREGDSAAAIRELRESVERAPRFHQGWDTLAHVHEERGEFDQAAAAYVEALAINPRYASSRNRLGLIWIRRGNLAEAQKCFARASAEDVHSIAYRYNDAIALNILGRQQESIEQFKQLPGKFVLDVDMVQVTAK